MHYKGACFCPLPPQTLSICNNPLTQSLTRDCFITAFQAKKAIHPMAHPDALFWCAIVVHDC
ncbi:hypothetical protein EHJ14_02130 [Cronobacter sakazakii]|nr:hypothetical protein [Cronobacter sakazakii]PQY61499.1 hypothetical protein C5942_15500 [Cronobacter sakazakii]